MNSKPESDSNYQFIGRQELGRLLTEARISASMTRDDVVNRSETGFSRSSLQAWESGEREPKLDNLYDLARLYHIHPWQILSGEPLPQAQSDIAAISAAQGISVEEAIDTLKTMIQDAQPKLTEEEAFLLKEFRALDDDQRRMMLRFIIGGFDGLNNSGGNKGVFNSPKSKIENSFNG